MALNYDGVYELRIKYTTTPTGLLALDHTHTIDVNLLLPPEPGELFSSITTVNHDESNSSLEAMVDAYVAVLDDVFPTTADITLAELWVYPEEGENGVLVSVYEIGVAGVVASVSTAAHQWTLTLTTALGGIMRVQLMETALTFTSQFSYPFPSGNGKSIADFLQGVTHPFVGRDNARPLVPRKISGTQNEKLARKRFRTT